MNNKLNYRQYFELHREIFYSKELYEHLTDNCVLFLNDPLFRMKYRAYELDLVHHMEFQENGDIDLIIIPTPYDLEQTTITNIAERGRHLLIKCFIGYNVDTIDKVFKNVTKVTFHRTHLYSDFEENIYGDVSVHSYIYSVDVQTIDDCYQIEGRPYFFTMLKENDELVSLHDEREEQINKIIEMIEND